MIYFDKLCLGINDAEKYADIDKARILVQVMTLIVPIIVLAFLIRAIPSILRSSALVSDEYFHLYCAKVIRDDSFKIPKRLPRICLKHEFTYPFFYHFFLALFPLNVRLWVVRLSGAMFDFVNVIIIYLFSTWVIEYSNYQRLNSLPIYIAALFAFSPALLRIGSGPRAYGGSPRVLGQTLYLSHILSAYIGLETNNAYAFVISMISAVLLLVTSKFGTQVLLFFGIFIGLLFSHEYFILLFCSIITSIVLTKGHALKVAKGHMWHSLFYYRWVQKIFIYPYYITLKQYLNNFKAVILNIIKLKLSAVLDWYFNEKCWFHYLLTVAPQFLMLPLVYKYSVSSTVGGFMLSWMGAGIIWFFLSKTKELLFLGEGERYLEYALFPSIFLVSKYLLEKNMDAILNLWLIYSIVAAVFYVYKYLSESQNNYQVTEKLFNQLKCLPAGVVMPIGSFHWQTVYRSEYPVLTHGCNINEKILDKEEFMLVYGNYPYPSPNFNEILNRYNVSYVITDRPHLNHYVNNIMPKPEEFYNRTELIFESGQMVLFGVKP